jgi:hypothetical protein
LESWKVQLGVFEEYLEEQKSKGTGEINFTNIGQQLFPSMSKK